MKAQVLYGIGNLKYTDVNGPVLKGRDALVRVTAAGICGSDVPRVYRTGAHNMPLIIGHEFAGIIEKCADHPELEGKRTAVFPLVPCMKCESCKNGWYEMCQHYNYLGSRCDGGFAEYAAVPVWNLLPLTDEVKDEDAAMMEPMSVAVHAMRRVLKNTHGGSIVICGLGTIGLLLSRFIKDAGFSDVIFITNKDIQKKKLLEMGFDEALVCDVRKDDPVSFIMDNTKGRGADIYFECIGRAENYQQAIRCMAPYGTVMLVGNPASDMALSRELYWKILRGQLTILGTWNSRFYGNPAMLQSDSGNEPDDWNYVLDRLKIWSTDKTNVFMPSQLITHRFKLENLSDGLMIMNNKTEEYIKIMCVL